MHVVRSERGGIRCFILRGRYSEHRIGSGRSEFHSRALGRDSRIHGAGVLADKRIEQKTTEQFERVFSVKVEGFRNLLHATANDPLSLICVFSSIAARSGNAGQADYAMANEVLNKVAAVEAFRRGPGCVVKSLNWGPWDGGMVTPGLKEHFRELGVPLIPIEEGAQFFVSEIGSGSGRGVEVVIGADPSRCTPSTLKVHL